MIRIQVKVIESELVAKLDQVPARLKSAIELKMQQAVNMVYEKAIGNLSGGKYVATEDVAKGVDRLGDTVIGYLETQTLKARIQETGTDRYYEILPIKGKALRFIGTKDGAVVFSKHVFHPPIPGKHYIEYAIRDLTPEIEALLNEGLEEAIT